MKKVILVGIFMLSFITIAPAQSLLAPEELQELVQLLVSNKIEDTEHFFRFRNFRPTPEVEHVHGKSFSLIHSIGDENGMTVTINKKEEIGYYHLTIILSSMNDYKDFFALLKGNEVIEERTMQGDSQFIRLSNGFTLTKRTSHAIITKSFPAWAVARN